MNRMNRWLQWCSFRQRIIVHAMISSGSAILMACLAILVYERLELDSRVQRRATTEADLVAANCAADLAFQDAASAQETLAGFEADPNVAEACLYGKDGRLFAAYVRHGSLPSATDLSDETVRRQVAGALTVLRPIRLERERIGTISLRYDLTEVHQDILAYSFLLSSVALVALLVAFLLSAGFVNTVSRPVRALAETARIVSETRDYSLRAVRQSRDELGTLTDAFNQMLARIQDQDAELKGARDELEQRVRERTEDLHLAKTTAETTAAALREQTRLLSNVLATIPQRVFWKDRRSVFLGCNHAFAADAGLESPDDIRGKTDFDLAWAPEEAEFYRHCDAQVMEGGEAMLNVEETQRHPDGGEAALLTSKVPLHDPDGHVIGMLGMYVDITERKEAEKEREELHRKLVVASRQAGMADVATGVLHNVGNVVNSLNISASVVRDRTRNLKIREFRRAVELAAAHGDDLPGFLTRDANGRHWFPFLVELSRYQSTAQEELDAELRKLDESVQHVLRIVSLQQSFARAGGISEPVRVPDVLDDALRMHEASMKRHGIDVVREYADPPVVVLDKHKLMQVILNLVSNGKHALRDAPRKDGKRLAIRCSAPAPGRIRVEVEDNGVGIPQDNLNRIFNYGFTTKKAGHGFGLHSSALVAKEMGGSLTARSDGPGTGAIFVLEILAEPKRLSPIVQGGPEATAATHPTDA
jgi:PAS domain S-box-containing protein